MTSIRPGVRLFAFAFVLWTVPASVDGQEEAPAPRSYAVVITSSLNVRAGPSLEGDVVGAVGRGDQLCVLRVVDDWAEVRSPATVGDAVEGFVSRGFISERRVSAEELAEMGCSA